MPNPLLGGAFPGQDSSMAAMAALSHSISPKKDRSSSMHESSMSDASKNRKPKKVSGNTDCANDAVEGTTTVFAVQVDRETACNIGRYEDHACMHDHAK